MCQPRAKALSLGEGKTLVGAGHVNPQILGIKRNVPYGGVVKEWVFGIGNFIVITCRYKNVKRNF